MAAQSGQESIPVIGCEEQIERIGTPNRREHCSLGAFFLPQSTQRFLFHQRHEDILISFCVLVTFLHPVPGGPQSAVMLVILL